MRTTRIRRKIKAYLEEKPRSSTEILEMLNTTFRDGSTMQQLGNILGKDKDIIKVGYVQRAGLRYGTYKVCLWDLTDTYRNMVGR